MGIYVARNSRAAAENLVDLYNQTARNYLKEWFVKHQKDIKALAFIPSGEEVFIIGITANENLPKELSASFAIES